MHAVLSHTVSLSHVLSAHSVLEPSACATFVHRVYRRKFRAMSDFSLKRGPEKLSLADAMALEGSTSREGAQRGGKDSACI